MGWSLVGRFFRLCSTIGPCISSFEYFVLPSITEKHLNKCSCLFNEQAHFWDKNFEMCGGPHPSNGDYAYLLEVAFTGSISPLLDVKAKVITVGSWEPLTSLESETF